MKSVGPSRATTRHERTKKVAVKYKMGQSRRAYSLRKDILSGIKTTSLRGQDEQEDGGCSSCESLLDLHKTFGLARDFWRPGTHRTGA